MVQGQCGYGTSLETIASQRRQEWAIGANLAAFAGAAGAMVDAAEHQARSSSVHPRVSCVGVAKTHRDPIQILILVSTTAAHFVMTPGSWSSSKCDPS